MRNVIHNKLFSRAGRLRRIFVLLPIPALMSPAVFAQSVRSITGRVVDEAHEPLPGATVRGDGGKQMTVTDMDGAFTIKAPVGSKLQVTYVGFETREVTATKEPMTIVLVSSISKMNEVVGGVTFKMRGVNSITGGTQPLFVIDGVPQPVSEPNSAGYSNTRGLLIQTAPGHSPRKIYRP